MKTQLFFRYWSLIFGLFITLLLFLIIGTKIIGKIFSEGFAGLIEPHGSLADWWSDPTPFFLIYVLGYAVVWWKPLWGSIIIMIASVFYVVISGFDGPPIFAAPAFLVGLFYLIYWILKRKGREEGIEHRFGR